MEDAAGHVAIVAAARRGRPSRRVLHVAQPVDGGVPRLVAELVRDQVACGWSVVVCCPSQSPLRELILDAGARYAPWPARRSPGPSIAREARRLRDVVRRERPDLVHLHSAKAGLVGRLAVRGRTPTVFEPNAWSFEAAGGLTSLAVRWERLAARWSDVLLCVSDAERWRGEAMGVRARYVVVPNGVDLERFRVRDDEDRRRAREQLGLSQTQPLALLVGRVLEQKGQDMMLDAWPDVLARVPDASLALVGDGPARAQLEQRQVARTTFYGERDDVDRWLAAADVLVQPSRWEGMSLVVQEALARGLGVVVTDVAGMREIVGSEGGAIVELGDRRALVHALVQRLQDPKLADAEGRAGRARMERCYDIRATTARVREIYELVLRERERAATPPGRS